MNLKEQLEIQALYSAGPKPAKKPQGGTRPSLDKPEAPKKRGRPAKGIK